MKGVIKAYIGYLTVFVMTKIYLSFFDTCINSIDEILEDNDNDTADTGTEKLDSKDVRVGADDALEVYLQGNEKNGEKREIIKGLVKTIMKPIAKQIKKTPLMKKIYRETKRAKIVISSLIRN